MLADYKREGVAWDCAAEVIRVIRERIARDIEAEQDDDLGDTGYDAGLSAGLTIAAGIARGEHNA